MRKLLMTGLIVGLGACAGTQGDTSHVSARESARQAALAEARPAGEPVDCVSLIEIDHTNVRSDQVIDFVMKNHQVLRNTLPNSCPTLGNYERFSYKTSIGRLCSVDTITVLDTSGHNGPTCGLGQFQPIELPQKYR